MISLASSGWSQLMYFTYCELPRGCAICRHFREGQVILGCWEEKDRETRSAAAPVVRGGPVNKPFSTNTVGDYDSWQ